LIICVRGGRKKDAKLIKFFLNIVRKEEGGEGTSSFLSERGKEEKTA